MFDGQKTFTREVDFQMLSEIKPDATKSSDTKITALYKRYYPFGSICSHIIGYTKRQQDINEAGVSGIEYTYDHVLKGKTGKSEQEINLRSVS